MVTTTLLESKFTGALGYDAYVKSGKPAHIENWSKVLERAALTGPQRGLVESFVRRMNVLVLSGTWCGDCVQQCPILRRIEEANPGRVAVRFLDRDEHRDLSDPVMICGGLRVPTVIFLNEDFEFCGLLGDRTLSRYRALAARQLGPSCPLPGAPLAQDELNASTQDWVDEFERVQLLLRLSPKLRERYGD